MKLSCNLETAVCSIHVAFLFMRSASVFNEIKYYQLYYELVAEIGFLWNNRAKMTEKCQEGRIITGQFLEVFGKTSSS